MRILLANDSPLDQDSSSADTLALAQALLAAGHDVHAVLIDHLPVRDIGLPARRLICNSAAPQADLAFAAPAFSGEKTFASLSTAQTAAYREALRRMLDDEIDAFDPQIIHCQHLWLLAHLALESGVPYIATAREVELAMYDQDPRWQRIVCEAAENAGRIIVSDPSLAQRVHDRFGDLEGHVVVAPHLANIGSRSAADAAVDVASAATALYAEALDERLGRQWRA